MRVYHESISGPWLLTGREAWNQRIGIIIANKDSTKVRDGRSGRTPTGIKQTWFYSARYLLCTEMDE